MYVLTHTINNAEGKHRFACRKTVCRHTVQHSTDQVHIWILSSVSVARGPYIREAQNNILLLFVKLLCALKIKASQGEGGPICYCY